MASDKQSPVGLGTFDGRRRVLIADIQPAIEGGRYPIKRVRGECLSISCDLIVDGHDAVAGVVRLNAAPGGAGTELPLEPLGDDRFTANCELAELGLWHFEIEAWVDEYASWQHATRLKHRAGQDVSLELQQGQQLMHEASQRATPPDAAELRSVLERMQQAPQTDAVLMALSDPVRRLMARNPDRTHASRSASYPVVVDPQWARFSSWYELFPRSFGQQGEHGSFKELEAVLPYVASMGFDVLYLPPIHPIGRTFRKGPNNSLEARPGDVGSPWAIGADEGGHQEIHPQLGTLEDFERLVAKARELNLRIALDIAFQASPDHPYVREHPQWFKRRPDGTIQYAENPPKKYQDVYPFDLAGPAWQSLWRELKAVFDVWIARGVRVFRVDNPHTKPLHFWEYCIGAIRAEHPDVVFLAEAFTRPKLMYALAKVGFSQSYTYFTWRNTADELRTYLTELTQTEVREFFRPNLWPNTPDILPEHLQHGGRGMFLTRMILAGTLSASWGIYGPPFELMEHVARPGSEEYLDNEKYQLRQWDLERSDSLRGWIARLNGIRRDNPALQRNETLVFHDSDNSQILAYSKSAHEHGNVLLIVVNLEPRYQHSAWIELDLQALGMRPDETFQVHDLLSDSYFYWSGNRVFVLIHAEGIPAHIFKIRKKLRTEHNFEYYA